MLTAKNRAFVEYYLICFDKTRAAIQAGYSAKTAHSIGYTLFKKSEIAQAISERLSETAMSADEVMMRLAEHARFDIGPYLSGSGNIDIDVEGLKQAKQTRLIKKLVQNKRRQISKDGSEFETTTLTVETYDAQAALGMIGKHHKLFTERSEVLNIDFSKLTDEQLVRISNGDDPLRVIIGEYVATIES